jgi:hypothetical protein
MPFAKLLGEELLALQNERAKPCVSVIVPQEKILPEKAANKKIVESAIEDASQYLLGHFSSETSASLIKKLYNLFDETDFLHNESGIGYYVSENVAHIEKFPFSVKPKIIIEDSFQTRELLRKINYGQLYYVLTLTEKGAHFFEGRIEALDEIKNSGIPMRFLDLFQYSKPSRSSSYAGSAHVKSFEKDKHELEQIRLREQIIHLDRVLDKFRMNGTPTILAGTDRIISLFKNNTHFPKSIIGSIKGNYTHLNKNSLAKLSWVITREYLEKEWVLLSKQMEEKLGVGLAVKGLTNCWRSVEEGNGETLFVESDYSKPGFLAEDPYHLFVKPPRRDHVVLQDAVDELIERTIKKRGRVVFLNNGTLKDHQQIALINRYR